MAFTYGEDLTDDADYVRFHCTDTVESESILSDAIITSLLAVESSKQAAVIAALRYKKQRMLRPDFKADWLAVSGHAAIAKLMDDEIRQKQAELGVSSYTATATYTYRADSSASEEPYSD